MFKIFHDFEKFTSYLYVVNLVSHRGLVTVRNVAYAYSGNNDNTYFGPRRQLMVNYLSVKDGEWITSIWCCGVVLVVHRDRLEN